MSSFAVYLSLFFAAFLAATIIPAQSEAGLSVLILTKKHSVGVLVIVAAAGNVMGAVVNWCLGRWINTLNDRIWFPMNPVHLARVTGWYRKYGRWSLLLSWIPFIGDPITVAAGLLREPLISFLLIVGFAKTTRYILVAAITLNLI